MKDGARMLFDEGYTPVPLGLDTNELPKRPLTQGWSSLTHDWDEVEALPWDSAKGIGIVLGPASGNLAVVDIDDCDLASEAFAYLLRRHALPRFVWTARKRCHIYVREEEPSASRALEFLWHGRGGRKVRIELKAKGTQVAAPPTPGYVLAQDVPPFSARNIADACVPLFSALELEPIAESVGGYPAAWQAKVANGGRNQAMYIEAHKLREAGIGLDQAVGLLQSRFEKDYEPGGTSWHEMEATIRSAYRKAVPLRSGSLGGIAL